MSRFPSGMGLFPLVPTLCSALDAELWLQKASDLAEHHIRYGVRPGATR